MGRKFVDCRETTSVMNCSVAISADSDKELLEATMQHVVAVHGHKDTPELRAMIMKSFKNGTPPLEAPAKAA